MELLYIIYRAFFSHGNLFDAIAEEVARYRCCVIQLDRMDSAWLLFCMSAVRELLVDKQKKYKLLLWSSGLLSLFLFYFAVAISDSSPFCGNLIGVIAYIAIILFAIIFSFYRVKVSKVKVWRGVLEAILIIPLYLLLSLLFFLILFWTIGFGGLSGVQ